MNKPKITVTLTTREYGGPEEGGWWYDASELLAVRRGRGKKKTRRILRSLRRKYMGMDDPQPISNYWSQGKVRVRLEDDRLPRLKRWYADSCVRPRYE